MDSLPIALDYLSIKSKVIHDLIKGKEAVLIKHGKIMEENLLRSRMTGEDLLAQLRSKNVFNMADVEFAVMETNGEINPYLKSHKKPVTAHDLGNKVAPQAEPQTVALDGNLLEESLASLLTPAHTTVTLVVVGAILGGLGLYDPLVKFAGAGASVPISSFGNSIVKGALKEYAAIGPIGVLTGIFSITSGGISSAIIFGFLGSLIFKPKG